MGECQRCGDHEELLDGLCGDCTRTLASEGMSRGDRERLEAYRASEGDRAALRITARRPGRYRVGEVVEAYLSRVASAPSCGGCPCGRHYGRECRCGCRRGALLSAQAPA